MRVYHHPDSDSYFAAPSLLQNEYQECCEVAPHELRAGTQVAVAYGYSTVLPDFDFETYSNAGYEFLEGQGRGGLGKWAKLEGVSSSASNPLAAVGAPAYAEHLSTEVLSLAYNLKDGMGARMWIPGMPDPVELFEYFATGGIMEAHNSGFEWFVWNFHCVPKLGWPPVPFTQLRCSMAKCRAFSVMAGLEDAGEVLQIPFQKQAEQGKAALKRLCGPNTPTKAEPVTRIYPKDDPVTYGVLLDYNIHDTYAESGVSACVPDMPESEQQLWLLDQKINITGVQLDMPSVRSCKRIIKQAIAKGNEEAAKLTNGLVKTIGQHAKIREALAGWGVDLPDMKKETVEKNWNNWDDWHPNAPADAKRLMQLRALLGSASVKKVFAMIIKASNDGRMRELFAFCGADRTGRFSGRGRNHRTYPTPGRRFESVGT